jgi:hypothetical protein
LYPDIYEQLSRDLDARCANNLVAAAEVLASGGTVLCAGMVRVLLELPAVGAELLLLPIGLVVDPAAAGAI